MTRWLLLTLHTIFPKILYVQEHSHKLARQIPITYPRQAHLHPCGDRRRPWGERMRSPYAQSCKVCQFRIHRPVTATEFRVPSRDDSRVTSLARFVAALRQVARGNAENDGCHAV
jgi:hypothetical protein